MTDDYTSLMFHRRLYAAMTYPRTSRAVDSEHDAIETCTYTCSERNVPALDSCQKVARESDKLRTLNVARATTDIADDIAGHWAEYAVCHVDGFDMHARYGVVLRMRREPSPRVAASGRTGVINISDAWRSS
ncbi:hypothetical protein psal_cds_371 [Pandoravirus salinus]|uniref:Uncharacterized protein n=1 Tax=Pandoravirus salinus TaxID=1349410 RepID=A0A291ATP0_9VIRU|nr:hypothetical protein psal_cds_371 [Pandoravirus salinus]ATE82166.1 hypothetical protein psal_cds_371 [Pandoravirus salinus]